MIRANFPQSFHAGDSVAFELTPDSTPPTGATLTVVLTSELGRITTTTETTDGVTFAGTFAPAATATLAPGAYRWIAIVEHGANRTTVGTGGITVYADPLAEGVAGVDTRTPARRLLDAIDATIDGSATQDQLEMTCGDRTIKRVPLLDLIEVRKHVARRVAVEEGRFGKVRIRFV